ncbi:Hca operon transcriptional activator HcaR [Paraburkholderia metrosideri]|jgi:DNA-binding transcriptional LysR family regulator|uniref:Hca operon transcriptional activator HcaR n=2 Tax=Paraburkholderia metrosideri TaxID=580937 RepID=A0ABM8NIV9_9BURK|nr:Hca operon transcriptional activator HcaR [Paraburkholderia metrosideri]
MINLMDLRHLRYFVAVAETGHFGRAAEQLHIVQPALSMQIRALEEEIGGALFMRTSRKVALTEAGALLLVEARRTLAQAERAKAIVQRSLRGETGNVKVGFAGNAVLTGTLMNDLRALQQNYPAVQLDLVEMAPHRQGEAILAGEIDVGYCPSQGLVLDPQLRAEKIGAWPMMAALADTHALASKKRVSLKALAAQPLIVYSAGNGKDTGEDSAALLRRQYGFDVNVAHRVSSTLSVLALAAAGLGVALVPAPLDQVTIPNLTYRPIVEKEFQADLLLISRADETDGAVRAFLALARRRQEVTPPQRRGRTTRARGTSTY